jgi:hypothetical protein
MLLFKLDQERGNCWANITNFDGKFVDKIDDIEEGINGDWQKCH